MTIGVYGFAAETFLDALTGAGVGLLLDLRQRRGVRGPDHSWPTPRGSSARSPRRASATGT